MIAITFLFLFLVLSLPGSTRGDLSDKDVNTLTQLFIKLNDLSLQLDDLTIKLNESEARTSIKLDESESRLTLTLESGFQGVHSFGRRRAATLASVSASASDPCNMNMISTVHALFRNSKVAFVMTPHANCNLNDSNPSYDPTFNGAVLLHPEYDFAFLTGCFSGIEAALNVTSYAKPELGDNLSAFGFGNSGLLWEGVLSRVATSQDTYPNCSSKLASHWTGKTRICRGELIAQGHQHEGMSGAAVLNSCGYVGLAHAARLPDTTKMASFAAIIPARVIIDFFDKHAHSLPTLQQCKMRVEEPPLAGFVCHEPRPGICAALP